MKLALNFSFFKKSKRGNVEKAEGLLKTLAMLYTSEGWFDLVYSINAQLAECQRQLRNASEYLFEFFLSFFFSFFFLNIFLFFPLILKLVYVCFHQNYLFQKTKKNFI